MKPFEPASDLATRYPKALAAGRALLGVAAAALFAATLITAGPGNYAGLQAAAPARAGALHVTLPTVVVVGRREPAAPVQVASAAATGAISTGDAGAIARDPGAIRVNLAQ
jgi:uncharacterized protein YgbK (DUF1537 family)